MPDERSKPTEADDVLGQLLAQEDELQFVRFTNDTAWELGTLLVEVARARSLAVTVQISRGEQVLFHYALPGTVGDHDQWIARKSRIVRRFDHSSLFIARRSAHLGISLMEVCGLNGRDFAVAGGAFPVIGRGFGVLGVIAVSGATEEEDHGVIVDVLRSFLADQPE